MKKEFTINHISQWDKNGTHYDQTINLKQKTFDKLKDVLRATLSINEVFVSLEGWERVEYSENMNLKAPLKEEGNYIFFNLTQRDFFNKYLKLDLKDRNTCFYIIK